MENRVKFEISSLTVIKIIGIMLLVWFLFAIREIVVLFFVVLVIVAALGPLVDRMAKYIPRLLAVIILSITFISLLVAIGFLLLPPVINQIGQLAINLPYIINKLTPFYASFRDSIGNFQENLFNVSSQLGSLTSGIFATTLGFISGVVGVLTILILVFYMLLEQDSLKSFLHQTLPIEHKDVIFDVVRKIGEKLGRWLRGQVLLMFIIGLLDGIILLFMGIPYALVLAVWGGLTEIIPYVGPWLGLIPAAIIALSISPLKGLLVLIAYVAVQQIEANFLAPKIMGKAVGLSPVIIILALLAGAKLMGIMGMLVAVPVAAVIAVLISEWPNLKKIREKS